MRSPLILVPLVVIAACSQPESSGRNPQTSQSEMAADSAGEALSAPAAARLGAPGVEPTAASGVAFNYRYDFRLAAESIAAAQEGHAQACEKLGIDRCRITGMQYTLIDERDVTGMLTFRLEPGLARQFGKDGIAAIEQAEGMLTASEINGVDEGANISAAEGARTRLQAERQRLEARLAGRVSDDERERLTAELADIRRQLDATRASQTGSERALAGTPMTFNYSSGDVVFRGGSQLADAFRTAGETMIGALAALIVVLGALLPIAALALILALIWRFARRPIARMRAAPLAAI